MLYHAAIALAAAATLACSGAEEEAPAPAAARSVSLVSAYQPDGVQIAGLNAKLVRLAATLDVDGMTGEGTITLDPNSCGLDGMGDPGACTRMATVTKEVRLDRTRLGDPAGRGRTLWTVRDGETPLNLGLIVPASADGPYRLFVDAGGEAPRVLFLERTR